MMAVLSRDFDILISKSCCSRCYLTKRVLKSCEYNVLIARIYFFSFSSLDFHRTNFFRGGNYT